MKLSNLEIWYDFIPIFQSSNFMIKISS